MPVALVIALAGAAAISVTTTDAGAVLTVPALALGAVATRRWPAAAVTLTFLLTGMVNVLFTTLPIPAGLIDYLLASLWLGVLGAYLLGPARGRTWLWPALLAAILYITLTAFQALLTDPVSLGMRSFRLGAWYMAAIALVALAPWARQTHARIAKGILLAALAVGAYSTFRWLTGAGTAELDAARAAQPFWRDVRFFGSFVNAFQLAAWTATAIPFCLATLLAWRRPHWRLVSLLAIGLMALALLASDVRTGLIAATVGAAITLGLFVLAPAFRHQRGAALAVLGAIVAVGGVAFAVTVGSDPQRLDRYLRAFAPADDPAYSIRLDQWELALDTMRERPWGHGLGTVGHAARSNERGRVGPRDLNNAYLKVGLEQGFALMALYILALLAILLGLIHRTLHMRDPQQAMLAMGGAGALGALMVMFHTGIHSDGPVVAAAWLMIGLGIAQMTARGGSRAPAPRARG